MYIYITRIRNDYKVWVQLILTSQSSQDQPLKKKLAVVGIFVQGKISANSPGTIRYLSIFDPLYIGVHQLYNFRSAVSENRIIFVLITLLQLFDLSVLLVLFALRGKGRSGNLPIRFLCKCARMLAHCSFVI